MDKSDDSIIDFDTAARLHLEGKVRRLSMERDALVQTMRENHAAMAQVHSAVLALVDAHDLNVLDQRLDGHVRRALGVDVLMVLVENLHAPAQARALCGADEGLVAKIMGARHERLGPARPDFAQVFGDRHEELGSGALLRLNVRGRDGLLALGSRNRLAFKPDQGADMAAFLARVIERLAAAWAPH